MGIDSVAFANGFKWTSDTSISTSSSLDINAGDILVCYFSWQSGSGGTIGCSDGGDNTFTMGAVTDSGTDVYAAIGWILSAVNNDTATFTATNSTARGAKAIGVYRFRPVTGYTAEKDSGTNPNPAAGSSASVASGAVTTTGTDELVVGAAAVYNNEAWSDIKIGSDAAAGSMNYGYLNQKACMWYKTYTETKSGITANATIGASDRFVASILALNLTAPPGGLSIPVAMSTHRRFRL